MGQVKISFSSSRRRDNAPVRIMLWLEEWNPQDLGDDRGRGCQVALS